MTGYSGTPLWKKLGYKDGLTTYVSGAHDSYVNDLQLPADLKVNWSKTATPGIAFVHLFVSNAEKLDRELRSLRRTMARDGVIWVSWPKKSSRVATDITEDVVRAIALPLGLVDIKVCAVNEVWSGLKLMVRKELRK